MGAAVFCRGLRRACIAQAVVLAFACSLAHGDDQIEFVSARLGIGGYYKLGRWAPLVVTLRSKGGPVTGQLSVVVPDGDDTASRFISPRAVLVPAGRTAEVRMNVKIGRHPGELPVQFHPHDGAPIEHAFFVGPAGSGVTWPMDEAQRLYVTVGSSLHFSVPPPPLPASQQVVLRDASELPTDWYGYDAVDVVILSAIDAGAYKTLDASGAQFAALQKWLLMGGRLVFSAGADAATILRSSLGEFAPGEFDRNETLGRAESLEKFAETSHRLAISGAGQGRGLVAARLKSARGKVVVEEGDLPLVVRRPYSFGEITFAAFDLGRRPIADWQARALLCDRLVQSPVEPHAAATQHPITHLGYNDLSGQLRAALDQFPGVQVVPFWVVGALVAGYMILVGPIDYLVVHRWLGRPWLTWITFPVIVVAVSVAAYVGARVTKGSQLRVNQVDLVDFADASEGVSVTGRGTSWVNLFSPNSSRYALSLKAAQAREPVLFSWLGLPGTAWGSMQGRGNPYALFGWPYRFVPNLSAMEGVPVDVWSSKSFVGRWQEGSNPLIAAQLTTNARGSLEGRIESQFDSDLLDVLVAYDRWAYLLAKLPAHVRVEIDPRQQRDLETVLKSFRTVQQGQNFAYQAQPYDPSSRDLTEILRQMMFYEAAGGEKYSGMLNSYQPLVDLSRHLKLGQAILVGRLPDDARRPAVLLESGQPTKAATKQVTYYRFLLNVQPSE